MIRKYISNFADDVPEEYYVTENQLDMFAEMEEDIGIEFEDEIEEEDENNEPGTGNREDEEILSTEHRILNVESQDESPETPPTLF